jgi:hypothetical protein
VHHEIAEEHGKLGYYRSSKINVRVNGNTHQTRFRRVPIYSALLAELKD